MVLRIRLLSKKGHPAGLLLALVTFTLGLGIGATIRPVTASRMADADDSPSPPRTSEALTLRSGHAAEVLRVLDGDTFEARVQLWPGLAITTRVRLRGIDTPELKARCEHERERAEVARDALYRILAQGDVGVAHVTLDKYGGRVVADASTRLTADVAGALVAAGAARRYAGGRRDGWC
jgi:endonuclease YncB( thermonuclease family)